uniref:Uncharacterized protein n=1 Tax=Arundo donax TaxID=35708 RepID=A0A0A9G0P5_ARUDO
MRISTCACRASYLNKLASMRNSGITH